MIWEDEPIDHDVHAGRGIIIALPIGVFLWAVLLWGFNRIYDLLYSMACGGL